VPDPVSAIAEPSSTRPLLEDHLHRFPVRVGATFSKLVYNAFEHIANIGLHLDMLFKVNRHVFEFHKSFVS
jgi:hypothetical protein